MPLWGVDIHPRYQAGINIEQIRREGFDFMAVKLSEARNVTFGAAGSFDWLRRGRAAGMLCLGYHYLRAGDEDTQARLFGQQLAAAGVPGMLDAEDGAGGIGNIRAFVDACRRRGVALPLMYLPRWYWDKIGRPSLAGLPPLWASRYAAGTGYASVLYQRHNPAGWDPYGGLGVEVLQFSDRASVAGRQVDVNHYRGTRAQFAALIGVAPPPPKEEPMPTLDEIRAVVRSEIIAHATRPEGDQLSPARRVDVGFARDQLRGDAAAIKTIVTQILTTVADDVEVDVDALVERIDTNVRAALAETHPDVDDIPTQQEVTP